MTSSLLCGAAKAETAPVSLDLSSKTANIPGSLLGGKTVVLDVGGTKTTVSSSSTLTPAEYVAALGTISSGTQTLHLNSLGQATSGQFTVPTSTSLANILVPTGVVGVYDFGASKGNFSLSGNFINSGAFFLVSSNQAVTSGTLSALNIVNNSGALLSSVLPFGGLSGFSNLVQGLSFNLQAVNNITNYGTIASAGTLGMTAGGTITNGALANILSVNNLNVTAPSIVNQGLLSSVLANISVLSSNITNSGLMKTFLGSISIQSLTDRALNINNLSGVISSAAGLKFGTEDSDSSINVCGGSLYANSVSFINPGGSVNVSVADISSNVSFDTQNITFAVANGTNGLNVSGLSNANSVGLSYNGDGNVTTGGFQTNGQNVSISTSGMINITGNITTSPNKSGDAGSVYLSAGNNLSVQNIKTLGNGSGNGGDITLLAGGSVTGGSIDASGGYRGNPGVITVSAGSNGAGNVNLSSINDNGVAGGGTVSLTASNSVTIANNVTAIGGAVRVNSSVLNAGKIDVGSGSLNIDPGSNPGSTYTLNLAQLSQLGTGNVTIGGTDFNSNIVVSNNCNGCLGNLQSLTLSTSGTYSATGTTLTLRDGQSYQITALGGINTGSVRGGSSVSFATEGTLNVNGAITMPAGSVKLAASNFNISSPISVGSGSVSLIPTASNSSIAGSQLGNISAGTLNIGNGSGAGGVTISGNADLLNIGKQLVVNLAGDFNSSSSSMNLGNQTSVTVSANNVNLGSVAGGAGIVVNARRDLNLSGNIDMPNAPVVLKGDLAGTGAQVSLASGSEITGSSVVVSNLTGDIYSGANISAVSGGISLSSGGMLALQNNSQLTAANDVALNAVGDLNIGSGGSNSNVKISAGAFNNNFNPLASSSLFNPSSLSSSGKILIDTYQNGQGTGSVNIVGGTVMVAAGNGQNASGTIGVLSGGDINVNSGSQLAAIGGNLYLSAAKNVNVDGVTLVSLAPSTAQAGSSYNGGQIAILAGAPSTNMNQLLSGLTGQRAGAEIIKSDASFSGNSINMTNGSLFTLVQPVQKLVNLSGNKITLNGGVLYVDPPPGSTANVSNSTITATGPQITSAPLLVEPGTTVSAGTTTNSSSAGAGGGSTGGGNGGGTGGLPLPGTGGGGAGGIGAGLDPGGIGGIAGIPGISAGGSSSSTGSSGSVGASSGSGVSVASISGGISASGQFISSTVNSTDISSSRGSSSSSSSSSGNQNGVSSFDVGGHSTVAVDTLDESPSKPLIRSAIFCSKPQLLKTLDNLEEDSWIIASSSCQPFTFEEHDGSLIVGGGSEPAKFAPGQGRTLLLREGKLLFITVDKIHVVRTPYCNITIPVNTAAVVEVDPRGGMVRIANLAGGKASVTVCRNDETLILSAAPGEQLILAESTVSDEKFSEFGYPEVSHTKVSAWQLELSGLRGQKIHFDRKAMAQAEPLLHCSMGCVNQVQLRRIEQLMQSMSNEQAVLKSMLPSKGKQLIQGPVPVTSSESQMKPIAFEDATAALVTPQISLLSLNAGTAEIKYVGACKVSLLSSGLIDLREGEALISANQRTFVKMGDAIVQLKPGTVAVLGLKDGLLKVRNVFEKKNTGASVVVAGKRTIGLQVGQELIVGPRGTSLVRSLSQEPVGRRRSRSLELASGHTCISSEFSLSSLMQNSQILAQLVRSSYDSDKEIARKILKMSVCLTLVTASHGNYSITNP